jgi:hypothetical protein
MRVWLSRPSSRVGGAGEGAVMESHVGIHATGEEEFLKIVDELAASFGWTLRSFRRDEELVALVALEHDPSFEQILWIHDAGRACTRCLLVWRGTVRPEREAAILELCARINDGLLFGCAEYSFHDRTLVFRDSAQLAYARVADLVPSVTDRSLHLGSRYAPAVHATLAGHSAAEAYALEPPTAVSRGAGA